MPFATRFLVIVIVVGLAILFWRTRPWPHGPNPRWFRLTLIGIVALWFAATGAKANPGGPFISVTFDILPVVTGVYVLTAAVRLLRDKNTYTRGLAFVPMLPAVFAISGVATNVLAFWTRYAARGPMIGP